MSTKNFVSYGDAETLFTGVGNKISGKQAKPTTISYADWLLLTPQQQETGNWLVTGVPGADLSLRVSALETNKQDKTDNNLQTTSKETTGAINELKSGLTSVSGNIPIRGSFSVLCDVGNNVFTRDTMTLIGGSIPQSPFNNCIMMIVNHSSNNATNDTIQVDGANTIVINAQIEQIISVMWLDASNIPIADT